VIWQGRVVVTANTDEESIRILPDLDISILDKIMLFRAAERQMKFKSNRETEATLDRELPYFARWLLNYQPPEHCIGSSRFGVTPYHEASLVKMARQTSRLNSFQEVLEDWKTDYYSEHSEDWCGTAHQFLVELAAIRSLTVEKVMMQFSALKRKGYEITHDETQGALRRWTISKPEKIRPTPAPTKNSTKFQK
jgi:hypothetical protein